MQVLIDQFNRPVGSYGSSVRNYAPVSLYQKSNEGQCGLATKPPSGKSFTIDALLAKPEEETSEQTSPGLCGLKYQPAAHILPLAGLQTPPAPSVYSANVLYSAIHVQPRYSVYCCPPFTYQPSCHEAFCDRAITSKVNDGWHPLKAKGGKSKRIRTSFTSEQLSRLEKEFARQQYMVGSERFLLASAMQLTEAQVKVWFQNRRIKWRKQSLEQQQAKLAKLGLAAPPKSPGYQGNEDEGGDEEFSNSDVDIHVSDDHTDPC